MLRNAVVLGGLGQMGTLISESLWSSGVAVTMVDLSPRPPHHGRDMKFLRSDVGALEPELQSAIASADCVCVCLPEEATLRIATRLVAAMPDGSLWMDTLSVKSSIVREIRRMAGRVEGLSINPMFAPVMGWTGNGVAVVEVFVGPKSTFFKNLLSTWGARLEPVDAEEHDRLTAAIQVATHAAVIAFGGALLGLNFDLERAMRLSTPPHRLMLTLLHRMTTQSVDVYWDIQTYHPLGIAVRKEMIDTLERLDEDAAKCEARRFAEIFAALNALFQPRDALFKRWAGHAFAAVDFGNDENPAGTSNLR